MSAKIFDKMQQQLTDDDKRYRLQLILMSLLFALIALSMSIVNCFSHEYALAAVTFVFGIVCIVCSAVSMRWPALTSAAYIVFNFILSAMLIYFTVTGSADGFSVLWLLLMPTCGMLFSGQRIGTAFCAFLFAAIVFLMWTPWGRGLLQVDYGSTFLLRFPLLYAACFIIGFFFEFSRKMTYDSLRQAQQEMLVLSQRDGMTGIYNRAKFTQDIDSLAKGEDAYPVGFIYVDINGLKHTNDTLSHDAGDELIESCVGIITARFPKNICYRLGGDEFLVILRRCTRRQLDNQLELLHKDFSATDRVSVSIGCAYAESSRSTHAAIIAADADMQKNKSAYYRTTGLDRRR